MSVRKARQSRVLQPSKTQYEEYEEPLRPEHVVSDRHPAEDTVVDGPATPDARTVKPRKSASLIYAQSPLSTPSLSETYAFDWEAARGHRPPVFATPIRHRGRRSMGTGTSDERPELGTPMSSGSGGVTGMKKKPRQSRVILRTTTWGAWLAGLPAQWWLSLTMMQHDLPLPPAKTMGRGLGILLHVVHAFTRWWEIRAKEIEEDGWGDLDLRSILSDNSEEESSEWLSWSFILNATLLLLAAVNALRMLTRTRLYDFQLRGERSKPINSVNASFISSPLKRRHSDQSTLPSESSVWRHLLRLLFMFGRWIAHAWNFLIHHPSKTKAVTTTRGPQIQRLEAWDPSEVELRLFETYSPLHALLWYTVQANNWPIMCGVMLLTSFQLGLIITSYTHLLNDRKQIHAEVMREYEEKFVSPRLNVIKKDACVMTTESEMVNYSPRR